MVLEIRGSSTNWGDPEIYLQVLAPDLYAQHQRELAADLDESGVIDEIWRIQGFAHYMARYAADTNSATSGQAYDPTTREFLINPRTRRPFTFEDIGFDRNRCLVGSTAGIEGKEQAIAELTIALYRALHR